MQQLLAALKQPQNGTASAPPTQPAPGPIPPPTLPMPPMAQPPHGVSQYYPPPPMQQSAPPYPPIPSQSTNPYGQMPPQTQTPQPGQAPPGMGNLPPNILALLQQSSNQQPPLTPQQSSPPQYGMPPPPPQMMSPPPMSSLPPGGPQPGGPGYQQLMAFLVCQVIHLFVLFSLTSSDRRLKNEVKVADELAHGVFSPELVSLPIGPPRRSIFVCSSCKCFVVHYFYFFIRLTVACV